MRSRFNTQLGDTICLYRFIDLDVSHSAVLDNRVVTIELMHEYPLPSRYPCLKNAKADLAVPVYPVNRTGASSKIDAILLAVSFSSNTSAILLQIRADVPKANPVSLDNDVIPMSNFHGSFPLMKDGSD